jgi:hypothetical protein
MNDVGLEFATLLRHSALEPPERRIVLQALVEFKR